MLTLFALYCKVLFTCPADSVSRASYSAEPSQRPSLAQLLPPRSVAIRGGNGRETSTCPYRQDHYRSVEQSRIGSIQITPTPWHRPETVTASFSHGSGTRHLARGLATSCPCKCGAAGRSKDRWAG